MMYDMQYIQQIIAGTDGSEAQFTGYVADNSPEMEPDRVRPAILILPGGGYTMTSDREAEPVALQFLSKGFAVFVLRYSVRASHYPVALIEAAEAMRLIRANASEWHVNQTQVAVLGFPQAVIWPPTSPLRPAMRIFANMASILTKRVRTH